MQENTDHHMKKKPRSGGNLVSSGRSTASSMCVGCGGQIHDQYILRVAPDLEWHATCLKCAECGIYLDETCTCFVRDGKTYCKTDYVSLFGARCQKCDNGFSKNDFVMRAKSKIFHIDCFRCVACSRQLIPGDEFALRDDGLFCKEDNDIVERSSNNNNTPLSDKEDSKVNILNNNNDSKLHSSGQESPNSTNSSTTPSSGGGGGGGGGHGRKKDGHKTTRVRTVLNEKQLHTLRTCYNANPRPDALMKEQLTDMTGLSSRVIRVWFQNKRCKDKKRSIAIKQMQQQQQEKQGVPMVASSPVRHEPGPNMQPTPVDTYQAPWKALSEFAAMGGDMEQAPFQQLVSSFAGPQQHPPRPATGHTDSDGDDDSIVTSLEDASGYPPMMGGGGGAGGGGGEGLLLPPPHHHHFLPPHHPGHLPPHLQLLGPPHGHHHPHMGLSGGHPIPPPHPMLLHDLDAKC